MGWFILLILISTILFFVADELFALIVGIVTIISIALYFRKEKQEREKREITYTVPKEPLIVEVIHGQKKEEPTTVPTPPTPYFAHPYPMPKNFTGREKERKELTEWLKDVSNPVFVDVAIGGMGKSALAWHWLTEDILKKESSPEGVIWWSFYDKEAGFESFLNHAIEYASEGEVDARKIESTRDKLDALYGLLSANQFILVLDGVERLLRAYAGMGSPYQGDEVAADEKKDYNACVEPNCGIFLRMLASVPKTKTLITTRICPKELDDLEGAISKKLKQMDKEDAVEFFRRQRVEGTRAEIEEVCRVYGFHPLSLRLLSGMIVRDLRYNCDIKAWTRHNPLPKLIPKEHNILELAYNSLDENKQRLISRISAFRNPMDYDAVTIFNDFGSEEEFNGVLLELVDRGLLFREEKSVKVKFDMHPIMRRYCYEERLTGKEKVHSHLRDYFAKTPEPERIESMDDLAPVIELYHHTVRAGRYDEAMDLFYNRVWKWIYYRFGAYQTQIRLLRALFPDGEDKVPRLKNESAHGWTLNELANSYSRLGRSRGAISLFKMANEILKKQDAKKNLAIGLGNLADDQMRIGELNAAEANLRQSIEICREINDEYWEAVGHQELGRLQTYFGAFEEAEKELSKALTLFTKLNSVQSQGLVLAYRTLRSLLMSNAEDALKSAEEARELACVEKLERDFIRAEWLLGASYLLKGTIVEAEKHLTEALKRDRKINLVELEPDILLEFAKLRFQENHKEEVLEFAEEALQIADRCEYRLKQADIHNFLAEFYLDADDLKQAKKHGEIAKERAGCGYLPALEKAEKMLNEIERR